MSGRSLSTARKNKGNILATFDDLIPDAGAMMHLSGVFYSARVDPVVQRGNRRRQPRRRNRILHLVLQHQREEEESGPEEIIDDCSLLAFGIFRELSPLLHRAFEVF